MGINPAHVVPSLSVVAVETIFSLTCFSLDATFLVGFAVFAFLTPNHHRGCSTFTNSKGLPHLSLPRSDNGMHPS